MRGWMRVGRVRDVCAHDGVRKGEGAPSRVVVSFSLLFSFFVCPLSSSSLLVLLSRCVGGVPLYLPTPGFRGLPAHPPEPPAVPLRRLFPFLCINRRAEAPNTTHPQQATTEPAATKARRPCWSPPTRHDTTRHEGRVATSSKLANRRKLQTFKKATADNSGRRIFGPSLFSALNAKRLPVWSERCRSVWILLRDTYPQSCSAAVLFPGAFLCFT